ncbi:glycosyltransferase [Pseudoalteromonas sp. SR43-3]|uniref:glycosyltransferase n=1 Tax=Pseudoalteromonas sp. SR43-3 TaxID=2760943 RepID=UPI0015FFB648|nr:glycosyltransferase [Pseudoalteromonas sp. SR43-3]MBB1275949.1 glycosyltransferase family 4 protein [Pseudoalteromonas sp. SR43-3]
MEKYNAVIITNLPAFYKTLLYNKLAKTLKIKVIYISNTSNIRSKDFSLGELEFDYEVINEEAYESRSKLITILRLRAALSSIKYDYLLYPGWEIKELLALAFYIPKKKNCVVIESSIKETKTSGIAWWLKKLFLKRMSKAFPSGYLQHEILTRANFNGEVKLTHGVGIINRNIITSVNQVQNKNKNKNKNYKYLYVGRLSSEKNLEFLVNIFNENKKKLTIVGDGPLKEKLQSLAKPNITFIGYIENSYLSKVYNTHDVFVLPSLSEPWGLVVDEALWHKLPVIVSNVVGCSEDLVRKTNAGFIFKLNSNHSLNNAIETVEANYEKLLQNVEKIDFSQREQDQINAYLSILQGR